ncbi:MAG: hypothetical protein ACLSVD_00145 [Eggerthellaceae bacterium]
MSSIFSPYHERYLDYLLTQVKQHPQITVHLKTKVTPETVRQAKPTRPSLPWAASPWGWTCRAPTAERRLVARLLEMINGHKPAGKKGAFNSFMWGAGSLFLSMYYTPSFARTMTEKSPWPSAATSPSSAAACRAASSATCAWRRAAPQPSSRSARRWLRRGRVRSFRADQQLQAGGERGDVPAHARHGHHRGGREGRADHAGGRHGAVHPRQDRGHHAGACREPRFGRGVQAACGRGVPRGRLRALGRIADATKMAIARHARCRERKRE